MAEVAVWPASLLLSHLLLSSAPQPRIDVSLASLIIELGAGSALPSVIAALLYPEIPILTTDYDDPKIIECIRSNLSRNLPPDNPEMRHVQGLTWGDSYSESAAHQTIDHLLRAQNVSAQGKIVIFLSDCIWQTAYHDALISTLFVILKRYINSIVYFSSGVHGEAGMGVVQRFTAAVEQRGGRIEMGVGLTYARGEWSERGQREAKEGEIVWGTIKI